MTAPRAVDLPVGSVVGRRLSTWTKVYDTDPQWEHSPGPRRFYSNGDVDVALANCAEVLRVGDGSGQ